MREELLEILHHSHHVSEHRAPMSGSARASKFSSYKALEGHEQMIAEEGRLTDAEHELSDYENDELNEKLRFLLEHEYDDTDVKISYFRRDSRKSGGAYVQYKGIFRYYRADVNRLVFADNTEISVESIMKIEII